MFNTLSKTVCRLDFLPSYVNGLERTPSPRPVLHTHGLTTHPIILLSRRTKVSESLLILSLVRSYVLCMPFVVVMLYGSFTSYLTKSIYFFLSITAAELWMIHPHVFRNLCRLPSSTITHTELITSWLKPSHAVIPTDLFVYISMFIYS